MVERLIQTNKRRLAVLGTDPNWSNETWSNRLVNITENTRLMPNRTTRTTPLEDHFGRKPNTKLTNILTKPSSKILSYKNSNFAVCFVFCFVLQNKILLRHDALTQDEMWRRDGTSEDELDIQYRTSSENPPTPPEIDFDDSGNVPLANSSPRKIRPSELHFSIRDHTTKNVCNKENVVR